MRFAILFAAFAAGTGWAFSPSAQAAMFTTRAAFDAAAPLTTTIDFAALVPAPDTFKSYPTGSGPTVFGASFSTSALLPTPATPQILFALTPSTLYNPQSEGILASESQSSGPAPQDLQVAIPAGSFAVGFDYTGIFAPLIVTLSDGQIATLLSPEGGIGFIGFTSPFPITSVSLTSPQSVLIGIGNFAFYASTPEPAALALLGVATLMLKRRRAS